MQVVVQIKTRDAVFPRGTAQELNLFTVNGVSDATYRVQKKSTGASATFDDVPSGDYVASCECLGVSVDTTFTVGASSSDNALQVPDSITVTMNDPAAPPATAADTGGALLGGGGTPPPDALAKFKP